ncbi:MAG TPA: ATP-binding protein [Pseudonocardiaceae bacterium]
MLEVPLVDHPSLGSVRALARRWLGGPEDDDAQYGVLLALTELVANAYRHTDSPLLLRLRRTEEDVLLEVEDGDPTLPGLRPCSTARPTGRGLVLLEALSTSWGTRPHEDGKTVWARFTHPGRPISG